MRRPLHSQLVRGTTTIELMVSFSLLTAVLGAALPLVVRHGRILSSARQYRIALDELSNQAERISILSEEGAAEQIDALKPSDFALERLPGAELSTQLAADSNGQWITLSLTWEEPGRRAAPVSLVAWLPREPKSAASTPAEGSP
jgi:hypothetical protein